MTHKTGNFKQFSVFTSMLESAILQVCPHVEIFLIYCDCDNNHVTYYVSRRSLGPRRTMVRNYVRCDVDTRSE